MLRILCALLCACLFNACSESQSASSATLSPTQELQLSLSKEPSSLDPAQAWDPTHRVIVQHLFEGLMRVGPDGRPQPAIAKSVEASRDQQTFVFHLRTAVWSNGDPVSAHDFVYAWTRQLDPARPYPMAEQLTVLKNARAYLEGRVSASELGIYAADEKTLVVALEHPAPYFLELVSTAAFMPRHRKTGELNQSPEKLPSNGPFQLSNWTRGDSLVLERSAKYWDAAAVQISRINWVLIEDAAEQLKLFEAGALDWLGSPLSELPSASLARLKSAGNLHVQPRAAVYYYLLNTSSAPLQNRSFRRALALAVDRNAIVDDVLQTGEAAAMNVVPPSLFSESRPLLPSYDPARAKKLFGRALSELGISPDALPSFTLSYNSHDGHEEIAAAVAEQWSEVLGIQVELRSEEWPVYLDKLKSGQFQIGRMGYNAHVGDPLIFLDVFANAHSGENFTGWQDPAYTALVEGVRRASQASKRAALIREAEQKLIEAMPIIPIYHYGSVTLRNPRLKAVALGGSGLPDFRWAHIE